MQSKPLCNLEESKFWDLMTSLDINSKRHDQKKIAFSYMLTHFEVSYK